MNPQSKLTLVAKGSIFRVLQTLASITIGFLMMPFLINELGEELYGLWIVVGSIVATFHLLDLGFSEAITRNVSKYIHQEKYDKANEYINSAIFLYSALGTVILLISFLGAFLGAESLVKDTENLTLTQLLILIGGITIALEFPSKAFPGVLSAYMRFDVIALIRLVSSLANAVFIYIFVSNGYGIIALAVITFATSFVNTLVYIWYTTNVFSNIQFGSKFINIGTLKSAFHFSKWVFIFDINSMLKGKIDIWLLAFYHSSGVLTVYYVAVRLIDYAIQFLTQATNLSGPLFTEYFAKREDEKLSYSVVAFLKVYIFCGVLVVSSFYLIGDSFILLWMGEEFNYNQAYICLMVLSLGRLATYISDVFFSLSLTLNSHKSVSYISILETFLVVILCSLLIPKYSMIGAALAVAIPSVICRLFLVPFIVMRNLKFSLHKIHGRVVLFCILSIFFSWYVGSFINLLSFTVLVGVAIAVILCHVVFGLVLVTRKELDWILNKIRRISFSLKS